MELSRRRLRVVHSLLLLAVTAVGCGREGGSSALPDKTTFCKLATELANDATGKLAPLGADAPLTEVASKLKSFVAEHRADYRRLDRLAPTEIRPALRRQRAAQRAFIDADTPEERTRAYDEAVSNGRAIADYERENCSP